MPDHTIDLRTQLCPMTFVRTRLALDMLEPGQTLLVLLSGTESKAQVPASVRELGHRILKAEQDTAGLLRLLVQKV